VIRVRAPAAPTLGLRGPRGSTPASSDRHIVWSSARVPRQQRGTRAPGGAGSPLWRFRPLQRSRPSTRVCCPRSRHARGRDPAPTFSTGGPMCFFRGACQVLDPSARARTHRPASVRPCGFSLTSASLALPEMQPTRTIGLAVLVTFAHVRARAIKKITSASFARLRPSFASEADAGRPADHAPPVSFVARCSAICTRAAMLGSAAACRRGVALGV
jgi:hypothetical protein